MLTFIYRLLNVLTVGTALAVSPLYGAFAECQKLGEYCGSEPTETFPACCPFDTNTDSEQTPLKCKNLDNGVGTCETDEEGNTSGGSEN